MQLAILFGLPLTIEIHILEESLETMRVGELGWGLGTRNFVWLLCGLIHKPKNVATISYALSSQSCDAVYLWKKPKAAASIFPFTAGLKSQWGQNHQLLYKLQQFGIHYMKSLSFLHHKKHISWYLNYVRKKIEHMHTNFPLFLFFHLYI